MNVMCILMLLAAGPGESRPTVGTVVRARLVLPAAVPAPRAILPYRRALVADVYEIVELLPGPTGQPGLKIPRRVLVARWAIANAAVLPAEPPLRGWRTHRLTLVRFDDCRDLASEKLILADTEEFDLPLYFAVSSRRSVGRESKTVPE